MNILSKIKTAWEWRKADVEKNRLEAFRLVNGQGDECPGLIVDYYAGVFHIIYKDAFWPTESKELIRALREIAHLIDAKREILFFEVENLPAADKLPSLNPHRKEILTKTIQETDCRFEVQLSEALHTGLFLDQRESRRNIFFNSQDRRVLNLFSYTGAFSVVALKGGAKEVVSVDLSKNYLTWLQRNVALNGFALECAPIWVRDVFEYLKFARKKSEKFDLIILDPPTFSRSGKGSFSTDRNFDSLVSEAASLLSPQGNLFASVNTLKMNRDDFQAKVLRGLEKSDFKILKPLSVPRDFKLTAAEEKNPYLKACWIGP